MARSLRTGFAAARSRGIRQVLGARKGAAVAEEQAGRAGGPRAGAGIFRLSTPAKVW
ncbi:MAG TPA: hypothetical protein VM695_14535 [Phycisphaerae bacterium]|nr:hypothetical protein [Phycisphaerae bacterium]